jgi:P27 family predicted phage terminase small subunit
MRSAFTSATAATSDAMALLGLCQLADLAHALWDDVEANGLTYEARGRRYMNPAMSALNETTKLMSTGLSSFGLTPSDRSRLGVGEIKAPSKFELLSIQRTPDQPTRPRRLRPSRRRASRPSSRPPQR